MSRIARDMDPLIVAAARALTRGDAVGALNRVALRNDPAALALRGIAMAQLGDLERARALLRRAAHAFGATDAVARARCVVAEAEVALASRELGWPGRALDAARATLEHHGDHRNAAHARLLEVRRLLLIGRAAAAEQALAGIGLTTLAPALRATARLVVAGIAMRRLQATRARSALRRAERDARDAGIAALRAEVQAAARALDEPAARAISRGRTRTLVLHEVEAILRSKALIVDACRHAVRDGRAIVSLVRRPVLFSLLRVMAEAWPADAARETLIARAFRVKRADESHRARLRVEIGRLRARLRPLASVTATPRGFVLTPRAGRDVLLLARVVEEPHTAVLALLADGESWSTSALALALSTSQRTVQRSIDALAAAGKVRSVGRGRARRWVAPAMPGFAAALLLSLPLAIE